VILELYSLVFNILSMTEKELIELLAKYKNTESEIIEFKEWKKNIPFKEWRKNDKPKKCVYWYCVWIWNEWGWKLFIWVKDDWSIVWTTWNLPENHKQWIFNKTWQKIETEEITTTNWKVILITIPSRQVGQLLKFNGTPLMRVDDSLEEMEDTQLKEILNETKKDWSLNIIEDATIDDLDNDAIAKAREKYLQKNPNKKEEIQKWDDITFLNKAKITINWNITNTAIILLWKEESEHFLSPANAKISWILENRDWVKIDYQHFSCPFILSAEKAFNKIRNLKYRYMNNDSLFPEEVDMYEPYIIRESLNNCIAHQDYELWWKINIVEKEDSLIFTNLWDFIPKTIENVIKADSPSEYYRNKFLSDAMVNINLIDTIGSWIHKMFIIQKDKYFPLPEYQLSDNKVSLTINWKILDLNYARKLALSKNNLSLDDIILLDKIQKKKELLDDEIKYLKKKKFIEWRKPNFHISYKIVEWTELVWDYIFQKWNIDEQKSKILKFIRWYKSWISKKDILNFVSTSQMFEKWLSNEQKISRLENILFSLKTKNKIESKWKWANWKWFIKSSR